ncbi:CDGSH iron-sulfur domain-containing protein [Flavobacteriaceae bacterium]|jgi:CDGSH-type Zn-finger protein|nr:CDGSH iron-sulfur domain-containing protein [Flavobacteriaceae bacterium]
MVKLYRNERGQIKVAEGSVQLVNEDGSAIRHHPTKFSICGCGRSQSILCDGSHKLIEEEFENKKKGNQ